MRGRTPQQPHRECDLTLRSFSRVRVRAAVDCGQRFRASTRFIVYLLLLFFAVVLVPVLKQRQTDDAVAEPSSSPAAGREIATRPKPSITAPPAAVFVAELSEFFALPWVGQLCLRLFDQTILATIPSHDEPILMELGTFQNELERKEQ